MEASLSTPLKSGNISNVSVSIETFMGDFGIIPMKTAKDEGLMSVETCRTRVLDLINMNIQNFKNNAWNADNIHVKTKEEALELGRLSTQELAQKFNVSEESAAVCSDELLSYYFGHLILECIEKIGHCEFYSEDKDVSEVL